MLNINDRIALTIKEIEYSDSYELEENYLLFNQGISILSKKLKSDNKEFTEKESDILVEIFNRINEE